MKVVQEFRQFIQRGNVIDMAVGVIMGNAFSKIVNSLVSDMIMPPIGYVIGGVSFKDLKLNLPKVTIKIPDPTNIGQFTEETLAQASINYGVFVQATFDFLIIALAVFAMVKLMNSLHRKAEAAAPPVPPTEKLLTEIRDLLQAHQKASEAGSASPKN
jgi:large conductance mechanosensitive channel